MAFLVPLKWSTVESVDANSETDKTRKMLTRPNLVHPVTALTSGHLSCA